MATKLSGDQGLARGSGLSVPGAVLVALVLAGFSLTGCGKSERPVPAAEVKTVEAYGVTLDAAATPQQVVYVLLRSIVDDYAAARAKDAKAQEKVQDLTFSLAAPRLIERRLVSEDNRINPDLKRESLGAERNERIYRVVHLWAPIVGYYLPSFENIDLARLERESWVAATPDGNMATLYLPVSHEPGQDPAKTETATIQVELAREPGPAGTGSYWRVARILFLGRQFNPPSAMIVQAYGITLDSSATPQQVASLTLRTLGDLARADKAGAKDQRASALYRLYCLMSPTVFQARARAVDRTAQAVVDNSSTQLAGQAVQEWLSVIRPVADLAADPSAVAPEKLRAANASSVVFAPPAGSGGPVTIRLLQQDVGGGRTLWRVMEVAGEAAPGNASGPAASRPAGTSGR